MTFGASARGVAVVGTGRDTGGTRAPHAPGVRGVRRGVRYFMLAGGVLGWDTLETVAHLVQPFGWHVQLQLDGRDLPKYARAARRNCRWTS